MTQILQPIVDVLHLVLDFFYGYVNSWGWSIILLTLTVRIVLIPLTFKQTRAMKDVQRVQPLLKELQEKHKGDREKLAQAQMALYKEHKVSPFGGCLPILLQMPIFFALFTLLRQPLFKGQGFGPIVDLSKAASNFGSDVAQAWPYYVLVILIVGTQFLSQKQTMTDPSQAKMMAFMPVIIGVISFSLPAGVLIYWTVFNAAMILQQWIDNKYLDTRPRPVGQTAGATSDKGISPPKNKPKPKQKKAGRGKKN
ncbi:MAG: YidC/Oxa1 family membrane protein insertase [Actinomycetota bacterium]